MFENEDYKKEYYELKEGKGYIKTNFFEGEYLNGERNGKGKIYDNGQIKFEGEFLNGQKNGKGKYFSDGILLFEGEYRNGKKHGECKEYYYEETKDNLRFEGEYINDHKKKGKFYFLHNKLEFEGEYLYDKKWNGKGYDENGNIIYELINGNGKVKEYGDYGYLKFEGDYLNGERKARKCCCII